MPVSPSDLELVDPVADSRVAIAVGGRLVVRLTENPTTGYRWHYTLTAQEVIECLQDDYVPTGQLRGSGGSRNLVFRASIPGSAGIRFSLQRAWETGTPVKSFRIRVDVPGD